jgi:hypothetical protein
MSSRRGSESEQRHTGELHGGLIASCPFGHRAMNGQGFSPGRETLMIKHAVPRLGGATVAYSIFHKTSGRMERVMTLLSTRQSRYCSRSEPRQLSGRCHRERVDGCVRRDSSGPSIPPCSARRRWIDGNSDAKGRMGAAFPLSDHIIPFRNRKRNIRAGRASERSYGERFSAP